MDRKPKTRATKAKGGCLVGAKQRKPKGGCKIGNKGVGKEEVKPRTRKPKLVPVRPAPAVPKKKAAPKKQKFNVRTLAQKEKMKSVAKVAAKKGKRIMKGKTGGLKPAAAGVAKSKAEKKARIQKKVRELGKSMIAKKKAKKKDFTDEPEPDPEAPAKASGGGGAAARTSVIPTTKQSAEDLAQQKLLKKYFKHNSPYGGGHYEVHGNKLYVDQYHYDMSKEEIDKEVGDDYGTKDWKRVIMGRGGETKTGWGDQSGRGEATGYEYEPLQSLTMGEIGLKKRELLKGFTEYDVYSTNMGHAGLKERYKEPRLVKSGLKLQKKGQQVFDMFGQKKNVDSNIRGLYPVKGEKNLFNTYTGRDAKYGVKFRFVEGKGFVEI